MKYKNCMLDLETLGTKPGCVVLSLGAVFFDPKTKELGPEFYEVIGHKSCIKAGLTEDPNTLAWWTKQSPEAQEVLRAAENTGAHSVTSVLTDFKLWVQEHSVEKSNRWVWGNGASFDVPVLNGAFEACGIVPPYEFWGGMCYRTMKNLHPEIKREFVGTKHNALEDAKHQALHLMDILP